MEIDVITSLSDLESATTEDKATKIYLYSDVTNKQFTYYQWDFTASEWGKLSDSVNGSIISNKEFIKAVVDNDDNFLVGIDAGGNVQFNNLPPQILDYIGKFFTTIDSKEFAYAIIDDDLNVLFKIYK